MNVLFVHDHKFRKIGDKIYSPGGLSYPVLMRYVNIFGSVKVIGRILEETEAKKGYSLIDDPRISVEDSTDLKNNIKSADAIIARLPSFNGYKAVHYAKKYKKNYAVEVVGCIFDSYWYYGWFGKLVALPAYLIMRHFVKTAPYAVYVTKAFLQKRYPCKGITSEISNVDIMKNSEEVLNKRLACINTDKPKIKIGTAGALDAQYKGQAYIINVIKQLEEKLGAQVEYELAGSGNSDRLAAEAKHSGVEDKVKFLGILPHDKIFDWLDGLDIYVHPSRTEGLSRAIQEAMSRGVPCVTANVGGNPELIDKECLFSFGNSTQTSENICNCIANLWNDEILKHHAKRNFELINAEYTKEHLTDLRTKFYNDFQKACEKEK